MKRIIKRLLIFLGIFAFVVWGVFKLFFYVDSRQEKRLVAANLQQTRLTEAQINQLEEGDIILRRGYGLSRPKIGLQSFCQLPDIFYLLKIKLYTKNVIL